MPPRTYMTIEEIAAYLKLPVDSLYKYARNGKIPAFKVGRYWRFDRDQIDSWVQTQRKGIPLDLQVLVIDDDQAIRELIGAWVSEIGCDYNAVGSGEEGLALLRVQQYDLVFLDLMMPKMDGVQVLRDIYKINVAAKVIIITGYFEGKALDEALALGNLTVLKKPIDKKVFLNVVHQHKAAKKKQY